MAHHSLTSTFPQPPADGSSMDHSDLEWPIGSPLCSPARAANRSTSSPNVDAKGGNPSTRQLLLREREVAMNSLGIRSLHFTGRAKSSTSSSSAATVSPTVASPNLLKKGGEESPQNWDFSALIKHADEQPAVFRQFKEDMSDFAIRDYQTELNEVGNEKRESSAIWSTEAAYPALRRLTLFRNILMEFINDHPAFNVVRCVMREYEAALSFAVRKIHLEDERSIQLGHELAHLTAEMKRVQNETVEMHEAVDQLHVQRAELLATVNLYEQRVAHFERQAVRIGTILKQTIDSLYPDVKPFVIDLDLCHSNDTSLANIHIDTTAEEIEKDPARDENTMIPCADDITIDTLPVQPLPLKPVMVSETDTEDTSTLGKDIQPEVKSNYPESISTLPTAASLETLKAEGKAEPKKADETVILADDGVNKEAPKQPLPSPHSPKSKSENGNIASSPPTSPSTAEKSTTSPNHQALIEPKEGEQKAKEDVVIESDESDKKGERPMDEITYLPLPLVIDAHARIMAGGIVTVDELADILRVEILRCREANERTFEELTNFRHLAFERNQTIEMMRKDAQEMSDQILVKDDLINALRGQTDKVTEYAASFTRRIAAENTSLMEITRRMMAEHDTSMVHRLIFDFLSAKKYKDVFNEFANTKKRPANITALGTSEDIPIFLRGSGTVKIRPMEKKEVDGFIADIWKDKQTCETKYKLKKELPNSLHDILRNKYGVDSITLEWSYSFWDALERLSRDDADYEIAKRLLQSTLPEEFLSETNKLMEAIFKGLKEMAVLSASGAESGLGRVKPGKFVPISRVFELIQEMFPNLPYRRVRCIKFAILLFHQEGDCTNDGSHWVNIFEMTTKGTRVVEEIKRQLICEFDIFVEEVRQRCLKMNDSRNDKMALSMDQFRSAFLATDPRMPRPAIRDALNLGGQLGLPADEQQGGEIQPVDLRRQIVIELFF